VRVPATLHRLLDKLQVTVGMREHLLIHRIRIVMFRLGE
jgi:hypothetical protein